LALGGIFLIAGTGLYVGLPAEDVIGWMLLSFLMMVSGLVSLFFGKAVLWEVAFPLAFLMLMIPMPPEAYTQLAEWLRFIGSAVMEFLLNLANIPFYREEYHFHLPNHHLYVDYSCGGIRYLLSFVVFSVAYAFRFKHTRKSRFLTVAVTVPIALFAVTIRLSVNFFSAYYWGSFFLTGKPHLFLSWGVFTTVLLSAIAVDQTFTRRQVRGTRKAQAPRQEVRGKE
jgi:exosortase